MLIHPDRLFPAEPSTRKIARTLYEHVRSLPIVSPHGHTKAEWFARNQPFPDPAELFVQPDHYIFRMLYSQGISLGTGDWTAGAEESAGGLAHLRQSLLPVSRNSDTPVAGLCLSGAFRTGAATRGRDRRSLLRYDLGKITHAGVPPARALRALPLGGSGDHRFSARFAGRSQDHRRIELEGEDPAHL